MKKEKVVDVGSCMECVKDKGYSYPDVYEFKIGFFRLRLCLKHVRLLYEKINRSGAIGRRF